MVVRLKEGSEPMPQLGKRLRKLTAQFLDLPEDVVFDIPRITMIGNMQLYIENHRGVMEFSDKVLKLRLTGGYVEITGQDLVIRAILTEEVFIEGTISNVAYRTDAPS